MAEFLLREAVVDGVKHKFRVYVPPKSAGASEKPPAILFLHGYGESGIDGEVQTKVGLGKAISDAPSRWPFLVVFPQKPENRPLWPSYVGMLKAVLDATDAEFPTDSSRRYLTGLSQGGNGTLNLVKALPWHFAAALACCGWADPSVSTDLYHDIPLWLVHGDADPTVPWTSSQCVVDWLKYRHGIETKYSLYPGIGHNCWDKGYAEAVPEWFLSHRLQ